jgi:hypothetical protein
MNIKVINLDTLLQFLITILSFHPLAMMILEVILVSSLLTWKSSIIVGSAYIYQNYNGGWSLNSKLVPSDGESDGYFGSAFSLSHETLAIGAYSATEPVSENPYAGTEFDVIMI